MMFLTRTILLTLLIPVFCFAETVTLTWQANTESDLNGYHVYVGTSSRKYGPPIPVGKTTEYVFNNLEGGEKYYFALTSLDTAGNESGFSSEVSKYVEKTGSSSNSGSPVSNTTEVAIWWTQYSTRSSAVPVKIYDGSSLLATKTVNQRTNGGKWNVLGSYTFKNSPKVVIIAQNSDAGSSCADAVRLKSADGKSVVIDNGKSGTSSSGTWKTSNGSGYYGSKSVYSRNGTYEFTAGTF